MPDFSTGLGRFFGAAFVFFSLFFLSLAREFAGGATTPGAVGMTG